MRWGCLLRLLQKKHLLHPQSITLGFQLLSPFAILHPYRRMSLTESLPPPRWVMEMNTPLAKRSSKANSFRNPPGFTTTTTKTSGKQQETRSAIDRKPIETETLKLKKAWEVALAPSKQIPMNAIMMYMSGNSLQIFSIMMVFMLFKGPLQGLLATNVQFVKFETESNKAKIWGCKAVYVLMQFALLGMGVWKVNAMGLLPTTRSDWLAWESERTSLERAYFAFG